MSPSEWLELIVAFLTSIGVEVQRKPIQAAFLPNAAEELQSVGLVGARPHAR